MRFLIDAQLPRRLATYLQSLGHDVVHTLDLPGGNRTSDTEINQVSADEDRIVVSKDGDFVDSFILMRQPPKLLLITIGNTSNDDLIARFQSVSRQLIASFSTASYVELSKTELIVHE